MGHFPWTLPENNPKRLGEQRRKADPLAAKVETVWSDLKGSVDSTAWSFVVEFYGRTSE